VLEARPSVGGGGPAPLCTPIASITPYQNKWTIKARVTSKGDIRTWNKPSGSGKLFSMDLTDNSGEIRVTAFKEQCDKFYEYAQVCL
jgi:replication factor A1